MIKQFLAASGLKGAELVLVYLRDLFASPHGGWAGILALSRAGWGTAEGMEKSCGCVFSYNCCAAAAAVVVHQVSEAIQVSSKKPKKISAAEQAAIAQLRNWMQKRKEAFERRERVLRECFKLLQMSKLSMAADPAPEANARAFEGPRALESWQQLPMRIPAPPSFVGSHMGPHSFLSSPGPGSGRRPRPRDLGPRFSPRAPRNQSPLKVKDVKPSCEAQSAFGEFSVDSARLLPNIHQSTGVS